MHFEKFTYIFEIYLLSLLMMFEKVKQIIENYFQSLQKCVHKIFENYFQILFTGIHIKQVYITQ